MKQKVAVLLRCVPASYVSCDDVHFGPVTELGRLDECSVRMALAPEQRHQHVCSLHIKQIDLLLVGMCR